MLTTSFPRLSQPTPSLRTNAVKFSANAPTEAAEGPKTVEEAIIAFEKQEADKWQTAGQIGRDHGIGGLNSDLAILAAEAQRKTPYKIHDFRVGVWGQSLMAITQSAKDPSKGHLFGIGENIHVGDYMIVGGKKYTQLMKVDEIVYKHDPRDMFNIECSGVDAVPTGA